MPPQSNKHENVSPNRQKIVLAKELRARSVATGKEKSSKNNILFRRKNNDSGSHSKKSSGDSDNRKNKRLRKLCCLSENVIDVYFDEHTLEQQLQRTKMK